MRGLGNDFRFWVMSMMRIVREDVEDVRDSLWKRRGKGSLRSLRNDIIFYRGYFYDILRLRIF